VPADVLARVDDDVAGAIVREAKDQHAALLVLATHGRRGVSRLVRGSVAEQVVRHATVPVVVLPAPKD
jgi:nucleotide-binding universal stress UspA family protein